MDFTFKKYIKLLQILIYKGFKFYTLTEYISSITLKTPYIILRHDIETNYKNALHFAKIQREMGIRANYYFRFLYKEKNLYIIKQIAELGHEIGYHYDDLSHCNGDMKAAIKRFEGNLNKLRKIAIVKTICMEGAPLSKWDNRKLWESYDFRNFGIIAEPYIDVDFNEIFYLTDTGRIWNGYDYIVRDKIKERYKYWEEMGFSYKTTGDIINTVEKNNFPEKCMITFHPQRWHSNPFLWFREFFGQKIKNVIKKYFYVDREWK